jgi:hypothetical protein
MLKYIVIPLALVAAATPAVAQSWRPSAALNAEVRSDINGLNRAIDRAVQRRTVSRQEAISLRRDSRQLQRLYASYARNGLTRAEARTLEARVNAIRADLRLARRDYDGWSERDWNRYGDREHRGSSRHN